MVLRTDDTWTTGTGTDTQSGTRKHIVKVMNEKEALDAMKTGLRNIDKLLSKFATMMSSRDQSSNSITSNIRHHHCHLEQNIDDSDSYIVLSKSDLEAITTSIQIQSDIEGLRNSMAKIHIGKRYVSLSEKTKISSSHKVNNTCSSTVPTKSSVFIPMSLIDCVEDRALHVPSASHVKDMLFSYKMVISIHQVVESKTCFEIPHVDEGYYKNETTNINEGDNVIGDDHSIIDCNDLRKLKKTNKLKWEKTISHIGYQCLTQQIYQVVSNLDLQLEKSEIDQLAEQTLRIAVAWNRRHIMKNIAKATIKKMLGDHHAGAFIIKVFDENDKMSNVHCHIGSGIWGDYHGIGMNVEAIVK